MIVVGFSCACGGNDLIAISPGHDRIGAVIEEAARSGERAVVPMPTEPDMPDTAWCRVCWPFVPTGIEAPQLASTGGCQ